MEMINWKPDKMAQAINCNSNIYSTTYGDVTFYMYLNDNNTYSIERAFGDKIRPINADFSNFNDKESAEDYFNKHIKEYLEKSTTIITNSDVERKDTNSIIKKIEFPEERNLILYYAFGNSLMITDISRIVITTDTLAPQNSERIRYLRDKQGATITDDNEFFLYLKANNAEKAFFVNSATNTLYIIMAEGKKPLEREKYYER